MRKNKIFLLIIPFLFLFISACEDYITNIEPVIDRAQDELLTSESQVTFLANGVKQRFSTTASQIACLMDLQSDQMIYTGKIATASFPTFEEIDKGEILIDNATVAGIYQAVGQMRKYADDFVRRLGAISFTNTAVKDDGLFVGNLYGGLARYYLAVAFAVNQNEPGATIDAGQFIPQTTLLNDAINMMKEALKYNPLPATTAALQKRQVNSLIAKAYLALKDYANAATYAAQGMTKGDATFTAAHNDVSNIYYWGFAGAGRVQIAVNSRMNGYITAEAKEANRVKLGTVLGTDGITYYWQLKYPEKGNAFPVMSWQENHLMLAECALRGSGSANALALVNEVRANYQIPALATVDIAGVLVERDKELFVTGTRLMDQHRTGTWHLTGNVWRYMPIPRGERNANPNLPAN